VMENCICGKGVRLRGNRMRINRKNGVYHYIEHMDGTKVCPPGDWNCIALKPYKTPSESDSLIKKWNDLAVITGEGE